MFCQHNRVEKHQRYTYTYLLDLYIDSGIVRWSFVSWSHLEMYLEQSDPSGFSGFRFAFAEQRYC